MEFYVGVLIDELGDIMSKARCGLSTEERWEFLKLAARIIENAKEREIREKERDK